MRTKSIHICHNFMRDTVYDKYTYINYIKSEENLSKITTEFVLEAYFVKHMKRITEG